VLSILDGQDSIYGLGSLIGDLIFEVFARNSVRYIRVERRPRLPKGKGKALTVTSENRFDGDIPDHKFPESNTLVGEWILTEEGGLVEKDEDSEWCQWLQNAEIGSSDEVDVCEFTN